MMAAPKRDIWGAAASLEPTPRTHYEKKPSRTVFMSQCTMKQRVANINVLSSGPEIRMQDQGGPKIERR